MNLSKRRFLKGALGLFGGLAALPFSRLMTRKQCSSCRHWRRADDLEIVADKKENWGFCKLGQSYADKKWWGPIYRETLALSLPDWIGTALCTHAEFGCVQWEGQ